MFFQKHTKEREAGGDVCVSHQVEGLVAPVNCSTNPTDIANNVEMPIELPPMFDLTVGKTIVSDDDSVDSLGEYLLDELIEETNDDCENITMETEQQQKQNGQHSYLQGVIASLVYMWVIESLFTNIFLSRHAIITDGNIDIYEELVTGLLKYVYD